MQGLCLCMAPMQSLEQRLDQKQALSLRLALEQKLVRRVHGSDEVYRPKGTCPNCDHRLTPAEIVLGFNRDPNDFTTKCPKCKKRFQPTLYATSVASSIQMPFYCPTQTLGMLKPEMVTVAFDEFKSQFTAIYRSATYHFGSLKVAFERVSLSYKSEPQVSSWQKKVMSFLGKLPDGVIASTARVSVREVRTLRKERGIGAYSRG
jgi:hypothetical protein